MADLLKYVGVAFKGICMGAADVIPGVSGGTIVTRSCKLAPQTMRNNCW